MMSKQWCDPIQYAYEGFASDPRSMIWRGDIYSIWKHYKYRRHLSRLYRTSSVIDLGQWGRGKSHADHRVVVLYTYFPPKKHHDVTSAPPSNVMLHRCHFRSLDPAYKLEHRLITLSNRTRLLSKYLASYLKADVFWLRMSLHICLKMTSAKVGTW